MAPFTFRNNGTRSRPSSSAATSLYSSKVMFSVMTMILVLLATVTFLMSISLGLFTLWIHPVEEIPYLDGKTDPMGNAIHDNTNNVLKVVNGVPTTTRKDMEMSDKVPPYERNERMIEQAAQLPVPYYPPFATIPNGKELAAKVLDGSSPSIGGIVYILKEFLYQLRESNKKNANVPNDKTGEDIVRTSYFRLATEHLLPLDEPYRGQTIFPIRTEEESIFISLAAFREHLLYETLSGTFGMAQHPEKVYVGVVMQNCFGYDDVTNETYECRTGAQVIGKDKNGKDMTKVSIAPPDVNGVEKFCNDPEYERYCLNNQIRVLSVHESEALGPAVARYYASKLWAGETYFLQADAHLEFTKLWDVHYINELKATSNYPKSVLSMYPPGFGHLAGETPGTRLCTCVFSVHDVEDHIIRINNGVSYEDNKEYPRPNQIPFIAAGFFFTHAEFLKDVPFDPFLPWCFMGEEIALSMRAWTAGWDIYAPRKNWIAHQYRPGRMGLPKFWGSVGRTFKRGLGFSNRLQSQVVNRIKHLVGYPEITQSFLDGIGIGHILEEMDHYGLGTERTGAEYAEWANIDFENKQCKKITWCNRGELD